MALSGDILSPPPVLGIPVAKRLAGAQTLVGTELAKLSSALVDSIGTAEPCRLCVHTILKTFTLEDLPVAKF